MANLLRDRRPAAEWASVAQVIEIEEKIGSFKGLAEVVAADLAALDPDKLPSDWREMIVSGELRFDFLDAERRVPAVTGSATAEVSAVCQRCLEPFQLTLAVDARLLLLEEQQTVDGYDGFEVWELEGNTLRPQDLLEELLIMALPFSAMHDNMAVCKALSTKNDGADELTRPFAALRARMERKHNGPDE
ncbi:MAG: DUF177 domain-containing protein [Proteobacteria bacterium]|nr:DUF177 domain-containing protein [Pseudomonadota bacterium]